MDGRVPPTSGYICRQKRSGCAAMRRSYSVGGGWWGEEVRSIAGCKGKEAEQVGAGRQGAEPRASCESATSSHPSPSLPDCEPLSSHAWETRTLDPAKNSERRTLGRTEARCLARLGVPLVLAASPSNRRSPSGRPRDLIGHITPACWPSLDFQKLGCVVPARVTGHPRNEETRGPLVDAPARCSTVSFRCPPD